MPRAGRSPNRHRWPTSARSPGWPSTSRCRTSTGRSTTPCRPTSTPPPSPASGCGSASPAGWSTASCSSASRADRARRPPHPAGQGGLARAGAHARPSRRCPGRSPTATPAALADVLRLAVPPRHARAEAAAPAEPAPAAAPAARARRLGRLRRWRGVPRRAVRAGHAARRLVGAARPRLAAPRSPPRSPPTLAAGRGALVVVPDLRDLARVDAALLGRARPRPARRADRRPRPGRSAIGAGWRSGAARDAWSSAPGPRCSRPLPTSACSSCGTTATTCTPSRARPTRTSARCWRCARPTRAPACWSAGTPAPPREPPSSPSGWARSLTASRQRVRASAPQVQVAGDDDELAGDAGGAGRAAAEPGLAYGARRRCGAARCSSRCRVAATCPALACGECRRPARCATCHGPLGTASRSRDAGLRAGAARPAKSWTCPHCEGHRLRATARRGACAPPRSSAGPSRAPSCATPGGDTVLATVPDEPALVVATPGAEPVAAGGYAAALLLDGWAMLVAPRPAGR